MSSASRSLSLPQRRRQSRPPGTLAPRTAASHTAARHRDIGVVDHLLVEELDRPARFVRPRLSELHADESGLAGLQREPPSGQSAELEPAVHVGERGLGHDVLARDAHLRAADRPARFERVDAPQDHRGARLQLPAGSRELHHVAGHGLFDANGLRTARCRQRERDGQHDECRQSSHGRCPRNGCAPRAGCCAPGRIPTRPPGSCSRGS